MTALRRWLSGRGCRGRPSSSVPGLPAGAQTRRPMTLIDLAELPRLLGAAAFARRPDARVHAVRADWKAGRPIWHLWRQDVNGGAPVQLTFTEGGDIPAPRTSAGRRTARRCCSCAPARSRCSPPTAASRAPSPVTRRAPSVADRGRRTARPSISSPPIRRPPTNASATRCATMCSRSRRTTSRGSSGK